MVGLTESLRPGNSLAVGRELTGGHKLDVFVTIGIRQPLFSKWATHAELFVCGDYHAGLGSARLVQPP